MPQVTAGVLMTTLACFDGSQMSEGLPFRGATAGGQNWIPGWANYNGVSGWICEKYLTPLQ